MNVRLKLSGWGQNLPKSWKRWLLAKNWREILGCRPNGLLLRYPFSWRFILIIKYIYKELGVGDWKTNRADIPSQKESSCQGDESWGIKNELQEENRGEKGQMGKHAEMREHVRNKWHNRKKSGCPYYQENQ